MKKVICDKCGKEAEGRRPENMFELVAPDGRTYYDFCKDCIVGYKNLLKVAEENLQKSIEQWFAKLDKKSVAKDNLNDSDGLGDSDEIVERIWRDVANGE